MGGAVVAAIKAPAVHMLAAIPAGESVTWTGSYRITSFDCMSVQAFLLLPVKCLVQPGARSGSTIRYDRNIILVMPVNGTNTALLCHPSVVAGSALLRPGCT